MHDASDANRIQGSNSQQQLQNDNPVAVQETGQVEIEEQQNLDEQLDNLIINQPEVPILIKPSYTDQNTKISDQMNQNDLIAPSSIQNPTEIAASGQQFELASDSNEDDRDKQNKF